MLTRNAAAHVQQEYIHENSGSLSACTSNTAFAEWWLFALAEDLTAVSWHKSEGKTAQHMEGRLPRLACRFGLQGIGSLTSVLGLLNSPDPVKHKSLEPLRTYGCKPF